MGSGRRGRRGVRRQGDGVAMSKLVSPVGWYVIFWTCGAVVFVALVRLVWINPVLHRLDATLAELQRRGV